MTKFLSILLLFSCVFLSCIKDKPTVQAPELPIQNINQKVFVINEGNYSVANASLSKYNPQDNSVIEDYYKVQNNSGVGDVLQSVYRYLNKYYLVVNNSGKILVCDTNLKKITVITGFTSPRYFLPINQYLAYVSDLYANSVQVVDLLNNVKVTSIALRGWTEQMVKVGNKVFVTNVTSNYVYVLNTINNTLSDSINVGVNASTLVLDKNSQIWVLSTGDKSKSVVGKMSRINPETNLINLSINFSSNDQASQLCINKTKDSLYFINQHVYRMSINDNVLPAMPFIQQNNRNFYGMAINPVDGSIYLSDALDYVQRSNCYVYNSQGLQINLFKAGINSNGFYFE